MNSKRCGEDILVCLDVHEVSPGSNGNADECLLICETCREQIYNPEKLMLTTAVT